MKKSDIEGWKKIYAFTFLQHYKNKASIITLIVFSLLIILSGPVFSTLMNSGISDMISKLGECKIENVCFVNSTEFSIDMEEFKKENNYYSKTTFTESSESVDKLKEGLSENSTRNIIVAISADDEKNSYTMNIIKSKASEIDNMEEESFSDSLTSFFKTCRMKKLGLSDEEQAAINVNISSSTVEFKDISEAESEGINQTMMIIIPVYAVIVLVIVLSSSQQIAVSIVGEKSSKLIETLMLSVRPLALIFGKVTATMTIIVCDFFVIMIAFIISGIVTMAISASAFNEMQGEILKLMNEAGGMQTVADSTDIPVMNINPLRIAGGIVIIFFTIILAFLFYSSISGITGAACNTLEEINEASSFISLSSVAGLYLAMAVPMIDNKVLTTISYIFPFSAIYVIPVHFMFGKTGILSVLLCWAMLIVFTIIIFKFSARIYHVLLFYRGERLKLKNIIDISKEQKGR